MSDFPTRDIETIIADAAKAIHHLRCRHTCGKLEVALAAVVRLRRTAELVNIKHGHQRPQPVVVEMESAQ
jgi:hypothetical protein